MLIIESCCNIKHMFKYKRFTANGFEFVNLQVSHFTPYKQEQFAKLAVNKENEMEENLASATNVNKSLSSYDFCCNFCFQL